MPKAKSFTARYGPWALVTGASSGIGQQLALQLAERQLSVLLVGRNTAQLEATAQQVRQRGVQAKVILADFEQMSAIATVILAHDGRKRRRQYTCCLEEKKCGVPWRANQVITRLFVKLAPVFPNTHYW